MKKWHLSLLLALLLIFGIPINVMALNNNERYRLNVPQYAPKHSIEELNQDIYMTLLLPYIQNAVDNYYKEYLTEMPTIAPYDVTILSADRVGEYRRFDFILKLELHPYLGAHNDVGLDNITIRINPVDYVKVEKFEHIKSYGVPPNYQDIVKKKLP